MRTIAHLSAGLIINISTAGEAWALPPECIDITGVDPQPGIGWAYDGETFTAPAIAVPEPRDFVPEGEFMDRWTTGELAAFYAAKRTDAILEAFDSLVSRLGGVRLSSQRAIDGKAYLVSKGLLTQGRADEIFAP